MPSDVPERDEVRTAELIAAMCLATDLGIGLPLEHGLESTAIAMRLGDRLGVDRDTAVQVYYGCLLFYVGCTADSEMVAGLFPDGALPRHFTPVMFGSTRETMAGIARALADPGLAQPMRTLRAAGKLPRAVKGHRAHLAALCEVAEMLSDGLGVPASVRNLFADLTERWDGNGEPAGLRGNEIPLALRIIHVARDVSLHRSLRGEAGALEVVRSRSGGAFDPSVVAELDSDTIAVAETPIWEEVLGTEPEPFLVSEGATVDRALASVGDFADLVSPFFIGHSSGVATLVEGAAQRVGLSPDAATKVRRAALVLDVGRVAVFPGIWAKASRLSSDEWERVRLHAYYSERVLSRSPFLEPLAQIVSSHHERLDGSGYHRRATAADLPVTSRLLAAADMFQTKQEPRPHRAALSVQEAVAAVARQVDAGRLDAESVAAVVEAAGQRAPRMARPAGLTERECQIVALLARGAQTKQVARTLGISAKTADRHVQNAYIKMGVSTRAAATLYAMQHGLVTWGELPMVLPTTRP